MVDRLKGLKSVSKAARKAYRSIKRRRAWESAVASAPERASSIRDARFVLTNPPRERTASESFHRLVKEAVMEQMAHDLGLRESGGGR